MRSPQLLDHFQNPRNVGALPPPAVRVAVANPVCGDELQIWVRFAESSVAQVGYRVRGCTAAIAAGSVLTEMLLHSPLHQISAPAVDLALGGLPAESKHAAVLCADAVKELIRSFNSMTSRAEYPQG